MVDGKNSRNFLPKSKSISLRALPISCGRRRLFDTAGELPDHSAGALFSVIVGEGVETYEV
jgi:hypothetical protein